MHSLQPVDRWRRRLRRTLRQCRCSNSGSTRLGLDRGWRICERHSGSVAPIPRC